MNQSSRNRSIETMVAAERAQKRATGGQDLGDIAIHILMRTCNIMMNERLSHVLEPHGLTAIGYITMMSLYSRPESLANPSELSEITGETRANMTRICDDLADKRWMRRVPNADARRRVDLSLTDSGMQLLNILGPHMRQQANDFYERAFSRPEKATLMHCSPSSPWHWPLNYEGLAATGRFRRVGLQTASVLDVRAAQRGSDSARRLVAGFNYLI